MVFVEIVGRPKPAVRLSGRAADAAAALGVRSIDLSMTHSKGMAAAGAIALIEGVTPNWRR